MNLDEIQTSVAGDWLSLTPEIRPSASKNPDGTLKPFFLKRAFTYSAGDRFELTIVNFADANGAVPVAKIHIKGHMFWRGPHPIAPGAQKVDFVADEAYDVTPLSQGFVEVLNQVAAKGYDKWAVNGTQSVFGKSFAPFGLVEGRNFMEYDLVHLSHGMLFWGARNIDGRGFDKEENRPTNLQIPLAEISCTQLSSSRPPSLAELAVEASAALGQPPEATNCVSRSRSECVPGCARRAHRADRTRSPTQAPGIPR